MRNTISIIFLFACHVIIAAKHSWMLMALVEEIHLSFVLKFPSYELLFVLGVISIKIAQ